MSPLPWAERVNMLSINPDAATRRDVARMASDIQRLTGADRGGYITAPKAAKMTGLSASTVLRAIKAGQLPARATPGGHYRVTLAAVQALFGEVV